MRKKTGFAVDADTSSAPPGSPMNPIPRRPPAGCRISGFAKVSGTTDCINAVPHAWALVVVSNPMTRRPFLPARAVDTSAMVSIRNCPTPVEESAFPAVKDVVVSALIRVNPDTSKRVIGLTVPIPTLPASRIVNRSLLSCNPLQSSVLVYV